MQAVQRKCRSKQVLKGVVETFGCGATVDGLDGLADVALAGYIRPICLVANFAQQELFGEQVTYFGRKGTSCVPLYQVFQTVGPPGVVFDQGTES